MRRQTSWMSPSPVPGFSTMIISIPFPAVRTPSRAPENKKGHAAVRPPVAPVLFGSRYGMGPPGRR
jgi:hypothetical protein